MTGRSVCPPLPQPLGQRRVGLRQLQFCDPTDRAIPLSLTLYYPAAPGSEGPAAPYAFPEALSGLGVAPDTACVQDAPLAGDGPFPLVLLSHGYLTFAMYNSVLCTDLASCGYVLAAIGHTGEAWVRLPDGTVLPKEQKYIDYVYEPEALEQAGLLIFRVLVDDGLKGLENLFDGLQKLGLVSVALLDFGKYFFNVSIHDSATSTIVVGLQFSAVLTEMVAFSGFRNYNKSQCLKSQAFSGGDAHKNGVKN